jgi:hypothetical protein
MNHICLNPQQKFRNRYIRTDKYGPISMDHGTIHGTKHATGTIPVGYNIWTTVSMKYCLDISCLSVIVEIFHAG